MVRDVAALDKMKGEWERRDGRERMVRRVGKGGYRMGWRGSGDEANGGMGWNCGIHVKNTSATIHAFLTYIILIPPQRLSLGNTPPTPANTNPSC